MTENERERERMTERGGGDLPSLLLLCDKSARVKEEAREERAREKEERGREKSEQERRARDRCQSTRAQLPVKCRRI